MNNEKIFITAFGAVTPIGGSWAEIDGALRQGRSGVKEIKKFDCGSFVTSSAGVPDEGNAPRWPAKRPFSGEHFYTKLGVERLLAHPNFPAGHYAPDRLGCILGVDEPFLDLSLSLKIVTSHRSRSSAEMRRADAARLMMENFRVQDFVSLQPSSILAEVYRQVPFSGPSVCHMGLCSASLQAIGMACRHLKSGSLDAAIVGGASAKVNPMNLARLELMDVISTDTNIPGAGRSRPFDRKRSGFVLGEGAVFFLLEKESRLKERSGSALLEICGYGASLSGQHIVAPHTEEREITLCMERAIADSGVDKREIGLVNAHGTSTVLNDLHESRAIRKVFGERPDLLVTANKSYHGHLIAAAGAMEVLNTVISSKEGYVPGTLNLDEQDPDCAVNVTRENRSVRPAYILKNSFGMGGLAASLVLKNPWA